MVDDLVPRAGQRPSEPAYVLLDHGCHQRLLHLAAELGMEPIVVDDIATVLVEQGE